jgi:ABC-type uncharacterized transport system fused permease/ATPase subunit
VARIAELDEVMEELEEEDQRMMQRLDQEAAEAKQAQHTRQEQPPPQDNSQQQQQQQQGSDAGGAAATAKEDSGGSLGVVGTSEALVEFKGVDIVTPRGANVAANLSIRVTPDTPLMVTGASAAGKSSLVRVLGGLWPLHCGTLTRPMATATATTAAAADLSPPGISSKIFLVPQKIHMATVRMAHF